MFCYQTGGRVTGREGMFADEDRWGSSSAEFSGISLSCGVVCFLIFCIK